MKLKFRKTTQPKVISRRKKKVRIRARLEGTVERPRLSIYKSLKAIYVQIIDDTTGKTLVSAASNQIVDKNAGNVKSAHALGQKIAELAKSKNISKVVFDRNGYLYHGKVKALAESARSAGLDF